MEWQSYTLMKITKSIKKIIDETNYRRNKQELNTIKNGELNQNLLLKVLDNALTKRLLKNNFEETSEDIIDFKIPTKNKDFDKKIRELRKEMEKSAKELDFKSAALYRDQIKNERTKIKQHLEFLNLSSAASLNSTAL